VADSEIGYEVGSGGPRCTPGSGRGLSGNPRRPLSLQGLSRKLDKFRTQAAANWPILAESGIDSGHYA
jgi:hypothetical protein